MKCPFAQGPTTVCTRHRSYWPSMKGGLYRRGWDREGGREWISSKDQLHCKAPKSTSECRRGKGNKQITPTKPVIGCLGTRSRHLPARINEGKKSQHEVLTRSVSFIFLIFIFIRIRVCTTDQSSDVNKVSRSRIQSLKN
jgi:hypothetical protein